MREKQCVMTLFIPLVGEPMAMFDIMVSWRSLSSPHLSLDSDSRRWNIKAGKMEDAKLASLAHSPWQIRKKSWSPLPTLDPLPKQQLMIELVMFLIHRSQELSSLPRHVHRSSCQHQESLPGEPLIGFSLFMQLSETLTASLLSFPSSTVLKGHSRPLMSPSNDCQHSFPAGVTSRAFAVFIATRDVSAHSERRYWPNSVKIFLLIDNIGSSRELSTSLGLAFFCSCVDK
mmetsp:Transcript_19300/g.41904  ORF Transcript_19300/g.41904 Transcript_19300/m.41904 type:complete len:230 (+) Transcript_19300:2377-3066(+)